jgi:hypothetical protein
MAKAADLAQFQLNVDEPPLAEEVTPSRKTRPGSSDTCLIAKGFSPYTRGSAAI